MKQPAVTVSAEPPCKTCKPELLPENYTAVTVFDRCGDNWITDGQGGSIGLRLGSIETAMRLMEIDQADQLDLLDQVQTISRTIIKEQRQEREQKYG